MVELRADFLVDERRVVVADECVENALRVAQQEAVALFVEFAHVFVDAVEQAQLAQVAQREVGRLVESQVLGSFLLRFEQQRMKNIHHGRVEWRSGRLVGLFQPRHRVVEGFYHCRVHQILVVVFAVGEFLEIACHAALSIGKFADVDALLLQFFVKIRGELLHIGLGLSANRAQARRV